MTQNTKLKDQGSKIKNDFLKFIADAAPEPVTNISIFKHFKKDVAGYQSLQIELVNSKLLKMEMRGMIERKGTLTVSNDLTDNPNVVGTIQQISYIIKDDAFDNENNV